MCLCFQCITYISYAHLALSVGSCVRYCCCCCRCFFYCCCVFSAVSPYFRLSQLTVVVSSTYKHSFVCTRARALNCPPARTHARSRLNRVSEWVSVVFSLIYYFLFIAAALLSLDRVFSSSPILSCVHHSDPSSLFNWFGSLVGVRLVPFRWSFFLRCFCLFCRSLSRLRCVF